ncbi:MAG: hypothetical protein HKO90_11215 [Flavobacteriaceae bacterium]|nr:hypothetical protein [Flavobacteriaceae bacterium]
MKRVLVLLIGFLFYNCQLQEAPTTKIIDLVPEQADLVLAIYDLETTKTDLRANDLIDNMLGLPGQSTLELALENLNTTDTVLLCIKTSVDTPELTIIARQDDSLFKYPSSDIAAFNLKTVDSFVIASTVSDLNNLRTVDSNPDLEQLIETSFQDKPFSILMRNNSANTFNKALTIPEVSDLSGPTILETQTNSERVLLNGLTYPSDSIPQILGIFANNVPQEHSIKNIVPNNADGYLSFTYNDFQDLSDRLIPLREAELDSLLNIELFQTLSEVGEVFFGRESFVVTTSIDASATNEALRNQLEIESTFRNVNIYKFDQPDIFSQVFNPLIKADSITHYVRLDDHYVFGPNESVIQNVIVNHQNGTVIGRSAAYEACQSNLSDAASLSVVAKSERLKSMVREWFGSDIEQLPLNGYNLSAFQWIQDIGFTHFNGVIQKHRERATLDGISEEFTLTLEADLIMPPQFVINHRTKERDIVVQDVNNTLYLISNTGKILWKKKLIGNVLGKIKQLDLYRNGRLQLAFATPYRLYVIDRNGNHVGAFPMRFGDRITQPLSVFDYDNNRRYRFLVTQGKDLLMYDRNARFVRGFEYSGGNIIKTQPKHFRIGNKDYIVFVAGKRMKILNRRGNVRVGFREQVEFSGNEIFLYRDTFMTTTANGQLIQVDQQGEIKKSDLKLTDDHRIFATAKTLVTLDENKLSIKQKNVELDFGQYTRPKIHYINDKIYVTATDLQSQKIYLFDSQAEPIPNFPVYGNSTIDLDNADSDRNLEFVTQGESNSIVMYKKN